MSKSNDAFLKVHIEATADTGLRSRIVEDPSEAHPFRVEWRSRGGTGWSQVSRHKSLSAASRAHGKLLPRLAELNLDPLTAHLRGENRVVDWRGRRVKTSAAFEYNSGWYPLTVDLIRDLLEMGWDGELHQAKEKFGGLRFYIGEGSSEIYQRITAAERLSHETCEDCGAPGVARRGGWIRTLCDKHAKDRGYVH